MSDNYAFVDLQGFKNNLNKFIVKEIAIITNETVYHKIVKATPIMLINLDEAHRKQTRWLTHRYHGLEWTQGSIALRDLRKEIYRILNAKIVCVKGVEKIQWLQEILGFNRHICEIIDIELICHTLPLSKRNKSSQEFHMCNEHKALNPGLNGHCALQNVHILKKCFQKQHVQLDLAEYFNVKI